MASMLTSFQAILSAIIIVSLFGILSQFRDLVRYARRSKSEAVIWVSTFLFTVLLDVDLGLLAGIGVSVLFLVAWGFFPKIEVVGRTQYEDVFLQDDRFQKVSKILIEIGFIKQIWPWQSSLLFYCPKTNRTQTVSQLLHKTSVDGKKGLPA